VLIDCRNKSGKADSKCCLFGGGQKAREGVLIAFFLYSAV
jgi:hypothetical protein